MLVLKCRKMLIADSIPLRKKGQLPEKLKIPKYGLNMLENCVRKNNCYKNCDKFVFGEALAPVKFRNLKNYGLLTKFLSEK